MEHVIFNVFTGEETRIPLTADEIAARKALEVAALAMPYEVRKLLVIDRLQASGFFTKAMAALGAPGSLTYERWQAAQSIASDDPEVRALLAAVGADPDSILARE